MWSHTAQMFIELHEISFLVLLRQGGGGGSVKGREVNQDSLQSSNLRGQMRYSALFLLVLQFCVKIHEWLYQESDRL